MNPDKRNPRAAAAIKKTRNTSADKAKAADVAKRGEAAGKTRAHAGKREKAFGLQLKGLCVGCDSAEGCMYRETSRETVHYCEEFFSSGSVSEPAPSVMAAQEPTGPKGLKGLCVNCENNSSCLHAKTEGGVWHCEEYM